MLRQTHLIFDRNLDTQLRFGNYFYRLCKSVSSSKSYDPYFVPRISTKVAVYYIEF